MFILESILKHPQIRVLAGHDKNTRIFIKEKTQAALYGHNAVRVKTHLSHDSRLAENQNKTSLLSSPIFWPPRKPTALT